MEKFCFLICLIGIIHSVAVANERPFCTETYYTINVTEGDLPKTAKGNLAPVTPAISCTDPENDSLTFSFFNDTFGYFSNIFQIDSSNGSLTWVQDADADAVVFSDKNYRGDYTVVLAVNDSEDALFLINIFVTIVPIDDNTPSISAINSTFSLPEDSPVGTNLTVCNMTDADLPGSGHEIPHVRIKSGDLDGVFTIDSITCKLMLVAPLDYSRNSKYTLQLEANDTKNTNTTDITIEVTDVNNHAPNCSSYLIVISKPENVSVGSTLGRLNCSDVEYSSLKYTIQQTLDIKNRLSIDTSGGISINGTVDYESISDRTLSMVVVVTDTDPSIILSTTVTVTLWITDVDDNAPAVSTPLTATISEKTMIGEPVLNITATDPDAPNTPNSKIVYELQTPCPYFTLDPVRGMVFVSAVLDYTQHPNSICDVHVYSEGNPTIITKIQFNIALTQANHPPVFSQTLFSGTIDENKPNGTIILTVTATDQDAFQYFMPSASPFSIDSTTGAVSLLNQNAIDQDVSNDESFLILIQAIDSGTPKLTAETYVSIKVQAVNDNKPVFAANYPTNISIMENLAPGTSVFTFSATDLDHGQEGHVVYYLVNPSTPFILERDTGILRVGLGLDAENITTHNLEVIAVDTPRSNPVFSASTTLTIFVISVNDNSPLCSPVPPVNMTQYLVTANMFSLSCTDVDGLPLSYLITNGNPNAMLILNSNSGLFKYAKKVNPGIYYVEVTVSDNGIPVRKTTLNIEFLVNEMQLTISLPPLNQVNVNENTSVNRTITNATATGSYDPPYYSIVGGNGSTTFSIDRNTGYVRVAQPLDREAIDTYTLNIQARTDSGLTATTTLTVKVDDDNDNAPAFNSSYFTLKLVENVAVSLILGAYTAADRDVGINAKLNYSICSGNTNNAFQYNPTNGTLTVVKGLDNENTPAYNLVLCVNDAGSPTLNGSTILFITVENVDEFAPTIVPSGGAVTVTISEDVAVGSRIIIINATDADRGSELVYTIYDENPKNKFFISDHTGEVYVSSALDRENLTQYKFSVNVTNAVGQSATTAVTITVTDVNDNNPTFDLHTYLFDVPYGTTSFGNFNVWDLDVGNNGTVTLSIASGNNSGDFLISAGNVLKSTKVLSSGQYFLVINASDAGSPPRSTLAYVNLVIQKELMKPSFKPLATNPLIVNETIGSGILLADVDATANGSAEGFKGDLQYSIIGGDPQNKFFIEPDEGHIQLVTSLSYASASFYSLLILAQNRYRPSLNSTIMVNVTVLQVNLNNPTFTQDVYNWTVSETEVIGKTVGKVSATDTDVGQFGKVTYSVKPNVPFQINATTGDIKLTSALEYSQAKSYSFYVTAVDNAGPDSKTSSAVVIVNVIDVNNHAPTFSNSTFSVTLPESFAVNQEFMVVPATDLDFASFGTLTYSITSGNTAVFAIDPSSGALSLKASLDYESTKIYSLSLLVQDGGVPPKSATASLQVVVSDSNDNAPVFTKSRVELNISSSTAALASVYQVSATDKDIGINSQFFYVLQSGNDKGLFSVDTANGQIKTTRSMDAFSGFYELTVIAVDQGSPPLTGTTVISITVKPVMSVVTSDVKVEENQPPGTVAGRVSNMNAPDYTIIGGNYMNSFTVNATGTLVTTRVLDREDYGYFQLLVARWTTLGTINDTFTSYVKVLDKNDNAPKFISTILSITVVENSPSGISVGKLTATDQDEAGNPNSLMTYTMSPLSRLASQYFAVNSATGQITSTNSLDYETQSSLSFEVIAKDNGSPQLSATATVYVHVSDVIENITQHGFNTTYFISHEFPHDAAKGDVVCTLIPEDFGLDPTVKRKNDTTSLGNNVFNVSRAGVVTVNLREKIFENGRYFQWMVLTTTDPSNTTTLMGLMRLDTFNKDKHLVAVVVDMDEATLESKRNTLLQDLQAKFPSPKKVKIWDIQSSTTVTNRRRLLAAEATALILVLADSASDSIDNTDMSKTFLTQSDILATLQTNPDGTPVSGLSSLPVKKVVPYTDVTSSSGLDTAMIVLIVFAVLAGVIIIAVIVGLLVYCLVFRRKKDEESKGLVSKKGKTNKKVTMTSQPVPKLTILHKEESDYKNDDKNNVKDTEDYLLPSQTDRSWTSQKYEEKDKHTVRSQPNISKELHHDPDGDGAPSKPVMATFISTSHSPTMDPPSGRESLEQLPEVEENDVSTSQA